jgi:spermidine synthase
MSVDLKSDMWVTETHKEIIGLRFRVQKTLFTGKSPFQQVDVVRTAGHGNLLLNDGVVMISERDEFVYHEMIAHVPLCVHPNPERVLIIGGGDGGTVREVLKHPSVKRAVMVEIDEMVVTACREHFPDVSCALDDPRLELRIEDGIRFVNQTTERFDVALIDSTDPIGPAAPLFDRAFYRRVAEVLDDDGIMITQAESPFYDPDLQAPMLNNQRPFFKRLHLYLFSTLTYPGGLWSFGFASKQYHPLTDFDAGRPATAGLTTRYYNPGIHRAAFMLPNFVADGLAEVLDPMGDSDGPAR